jgi:hypothetical protein
MACVPYRFARLGRDLTTKQALLSQRLPASVLTAFSDHIEQLFESFVLLRLLESDIDIHHRRLVQAAFEVHGTVQVHLAI